MSFIRRGRDLGLALEQVRELLRLTDDPGQPCTEVAALAGGISMMGKGMTANLQKAGHDLVVHDLSRAAAEPFLAKGAVWANSPREVGKQTEIVFTSLPVPADIEQVALGLNGLIEGMRPDAAFFDMSTNSVATVRKIHAAFAEKNLYMLDSPVSGALDDQGSGCAIQ